jgi:hypothetical protein
VGDADRRDVQHRTEVEGEAGSAGMVSAGCVDQQHIRRSREGSHGGFEQWSLSEGQQARLVCCAGTARHHERLLPDTGRCPRRVASVARAAAASGEADEDAADPSAWLEAPRRKLERGQAQLLLDQLLA